MLCNGPGDVACGGAKALDLESRQCHCALCRSFELKTAEGRARALMTELKDLREEKREAFQRAIALREEGLRVALAMSTVHPHPMSHGAVQIIVCLMSRCKLHEPIAFSTTHSWKSESQNRYLPSPLAAGFSDFVLSNMYSLLASLRN